MKNANTDTGYLNFIQEVAMTQLHKRFSDEQVSFLLHSYSQDLLSRQDVQDTLSIGKMRFPQA
jgi:hypothetical protein